MKIELVGDLVVSRILRAIVHRAHCVYVRVDGISGEMAQHLYIYELCKHERSQGMRCKW